MSRTSLVALIVAALAASAPAAISREIGRVVLEQLRTEQQAAVMAAARTPASKPEIDLKPLLGVQRGELLAVLGIPDFCALPVDTSCVESTRLAYFFYPRKPGTSRDVANGLVEVTVTAGGGWALELKVAHDAIVQASWVKQE